MPRPPREPRSAAGAYYSPDPMSPTFSPPGEYTEFQTLRPSTPGTPGSFGRYSAYSEKYERDGAATPAGQGLLSTDSTRGQRSSTYYFDKEGAAAGAGAGAAATAYQGRRGQGYNPANNAGLEGGMGVAKRPNFIRRRPILFTLLCLLVLVAAGVGAGVGISQSNKGNNHNLSANSDASNGNKGSSGSNSGVSSNSGNTGASSRGSATPTSSAPAAPSITPFAKWNWTDPNAKVYGANLGAWLVLERWLIEDWFVAQAGPQAWDEWDFAEDLGSKAASVLEDHYNSFVTEADFDTMQKAGINTIRLPIPFWAFIPTVAPEPYVVNNDIVNQMNKIMGWCYSRGMYVALDLHAMPGSQNGDQSSGLNTTNIQWFTPANQARSDTFLEKVLQWATTSNYSSIVSAINVVNEPRIVNDDWSMNQTRFSLTQQYYERSYATCNKYGIPMTFHNGFAPGGVTGAMQTWAPFVSGKNPAMLIYENHPYPGWFAKPEPTEQQTQTYVCQYGPAAQTFGIPVLMGEFSAIQNSNSTSYAQSYLQMQYAEYGQSAGSIFWNFKANPSNNPVLALSASKMQLYSYVDLYAAGLMPNPGQGANVNNWQSGLPNPCGNYQTYGWSNPAP